MGEVRPEEVAAALSRVFARPEFAERGLPGFLQWIADFWRGILSWFASLLTSLPRFDEAAYVIFWVTAAGVLLVLLLALGHVVYSMAPSLRRSRPAAAPPGAGQGAAGSELDAAAWERIARDAASAGRLRDAVLALYHAVVLRLADRGTLRFRAGKTPGEYRREALRDPELAARFDAFLRLFLPLAFGPRPPDADRYAALEALAVEVVSRG